MFCIGIIGDDGKFQTMNLLLRLYELKGFRVFHKNIEKEKVISQEELKDIAAFGCNILLVTLKYEDIKDFAGLKFHILMYLRGLDESEGIKVLPQLLEDKNILIINTDDRNIFPFGIHAGTTLITCGTNSKASVTVSSIVCESNWETIQCCIQRSIPTLTGERFEPQEFAVNVDDTLKDKVTDVLAVVAAAIADDMEVSDLNFSLLENYSSKP